ncbi:IS66 family insertion sequence element accessory protein TnpA [Gudongella sp. DL1XJH-153]|uniref:IS66 family insertion sequence element accessory protein TnpA n=1 Tax=Gudongella sp. DL1XJH-153 TaxID=3409804 RepID=UPI003BB570FB
MDKKANQQYWKQVMEDQGSSGLTQAIWCEKNNVNIHNFRYWKRRLRDEEDSDANNPDPQWALVTNSPGAHKVIEDSSLPLASKTGAVIKSGKLSVEFTGPVNIETLTRVMEFLISHDR